MNEQDKIAFMEGYMTKSAGIGGAVAGGVLGAAAGGLGTMAYNLSDVKDILHADEAGTGLFGDAYRDQRSEEDLNNDIENAMFRRTGRNAKIGGGVGLALGALLSSIGSNTDKAAVGSDIGSVAADVV